MTTTSLAKVLTPRMRAVAARYRLHHPLSKIAARAGFYPVPSCRGGAPWWLPLVWYPSPACTWALAGGCTTCNFGDGEGDLSDETIAREVREVMGSLDRGLQGIFLAPGGSFFNTTELSASARARLFGELARFPFLNFVGVESRTEFITEEVIRDAIDRLPRTVRQFTIGFGIESSDELIREVCVNKAVSQAKLNRTISMISSVSGYRGVRVGFEAYVLLKPIWLSEAEAIDDAVATLNWAGAAGADTLGLFLNVVKPQTICSLLHSARTEGAPYRYETPYWRSAWEVLARLSPDTAARVQVLGPVSESQVEARPRACELCEDFTSGLMTSWNLNRDQSAITIGRMKYCSCIADWERECAVVLPSLQDRLPDYLDRLERMV